MNLYFVLSEELESVGMGYAPPEPYCIAVLIVARSRSQARYMAWKKDCEFERLPWVDVRDMPRMSVHKLADIGETKARIVTDTRRWERWWGKTEKFQVPGGKEVQE